MKGFIGGLLFIALIAIYYSSGDPTKNSRAHDFAIVAIIATMIMLGSL